MKPSQSNPHNSSLSTEHFKKLVKLAARAFYDDITKGDNPSKNTRTDNRGIAVVVLDALTTRLWVREEDLAKDLKLQTKQLRRTLRFFEQEKLIAVDHRKETAKGAKIYNAAFAATVENGSGNKESDEKIKLHTHSYCCLDYAQIHDVVRYRLHRMKKYLKDQLDDKNKIQEYLCPNCRKKYNALDVSRLISMEDMNFHCESCNAELITETDSVGEKDVGAGEGDDNARKRSREKYRDMLERMEVQLKPLVDQLNRVKDLVAPELESLQAWEARMILMKRGGNGGNGGDDRGGQGFGPPMPYVGEPKVEVAISGVDDVGGDGGGKKGDGVAKVLPPWMIMQGMKLTKEQRGEVKEEVGDGSLATLGASDDKKKAVSEPEDSKNLQDQYIQAYYDALLKRQREQDEAIKREQDTDDAHVLPTERVVGEKSKREDDDDGEDVEWEEEAPLPGGGDNTSGNFKVDLNVEAAVSEEEDEDDIDWEEG